MRYIIVTHTDMDGVAAAAIYIYYTASKPEKIIFAEPYNIEKKLKKLRNVSVEKIAIMDMGVNATNIHEVISIINELVSRGISIEWYDHHVWDQEWYNKLIEAGVKLFVDRSTCATGVVAKYYTPSRKDIDELFVKELVAGVCAGDLWTFDHWRGPWYMRLIRRSDSTNWRLHVLEKLSKGILWDSEFTENVIEKIDRELLSYNIIRDKIVQDTVDGIKIAVAPKHDGVETSFAAAYILGRLGADIACIVSKDGKMSLRSRRVNVREIAKLLGGGGHPRAAGAKIKIPLRVRVIDKFIEGTSERYVLKTIANTIKTIGLNKIKLGNG